MKNNQPHINIFIAYSSRDNEKYDYLEEIRIELQNIKLEDKYKNVQIWYDGEIPAGGKWNEEIIKKITNKLPL